MYIIFPGSVVGNHICSHPDIRKLGFTGSTQTGKSIMERYVLCVYYQLITTLIEYTGLEIKKKTAVAFWQLLLIKINS